jgi:AcrR family transcriptional regulator
MGRRSEHTPDALRELIIEACEAIISESGLAGLSAREIAKRVGYSPGTIYNVFDSLDDLILQVEARVLDGLDARLAALKNEGSTNDRILSLARAYLAFTTERPRLWNLLFEHHLPAAMQVPSWYQHKLDQLLDRVEVVVRPLVRDHDGSGAKRAARVLWAGVHGITSLATTDKLSSVTSEDAVALVDDLVLNYLAGLSHQPDRDHKLLKAFG